MEEDKKTVEKSIYNRGFRIFLASFLSAGLILSTVERLFMENAPDFLQGFFIGASIAAMAVGLVYIFWSWSKGIHSYKFN